MTRAPLNRKIHQALGWTLVFFFGASPLASLLALTNDPACQMACCDRKHHTASCPLHPSGVSDVAPIHFEATNNCPVNCSCAGIAPSASDQVLLPLRAVIGPIQCDSGKTHFFQARTVRSAIDPFLYQRPPPLPA